MRIALALLVVLVIAASCGGPDSTASEGVAGEYVMGDAKEARRKATEPEPENPLAGLTTKDLLDRMEAGEEFSITASVDILLILHGDGTFEYYGPLKMGDDEGLVRGRWDHEGTSVRLRPDQPRESRGETVSVLVCPYRPGVVSYPMGRNPKTSVYYRLLAVRHPDELGPGDGGVQIGGGERAGAK